MGSPALWLYLDSVRPGRALRRVVWLPDDTGGSNFATAARWSPASGRARALLGRSLVLHWRVSERSFARWLTPWDVDDASASDSDRAACMRRPSADPAEAGGRRFPIDGSDAELSPLRRVYGVARDAGRDRPARAPVSSRATWSSCGGRSGASAVRSTCWCSGISIRSSNWWHDCSVIRLRPRTWHRSPSSRPTVRSVPSEATARSTPGCTASPSIPRAMRWRRASAGRSITRAT